MRVCVSSKGKRKLPLSGFPLFCQSSINVNQRQSKGKESYRFQLSRLCQSCCFVNRQSKEESYRFKYSSLSVHANQREKKATALTIPSFRYSCCFVNQRKKKATAFNCFSITMSYYGSTKVFKLRFARFQTLYVNYIFF